MNSSREDYILTIYRLTKKKYYTNNISIARSLKISRASVSEMIRKLADDGLIEQIGHKISLTEKGEKVAKDIISTHRLWEYFLIEHLKMTEDEAHEASDLLEHATGEKLRNALNDYLDYPKFTTSGKKIYKNLEK
ncbi:MAG: metal-dependent transcriptional regulator [Tissierellia bacterium]|nr:metal-dependent transcriptional regulator [Tissierellia bacterium]